MEAYLALFLVVAVAIIILQGYEREKLLDTVEKQAKDFLQYKKEEEELYTLVRDGDIARYKAKRAEAIEKAMEAQAQVHRIPYTGGE